MKTVIEQINNANKNLIKLENKIDELHDIYLESLDRNEKLWALRCDGWTYEKLAKKFKLSRPTVTEICNKAFHHGCYYEHHMYGRSVEDILKKEDDYIQWNSNKQQLETEEGRITNWVLPGRKI